MRIIKKLKSNNNESAINCKSGEAATAVYNYSST